MLLSSPFTGDGPCYQVAPLPYHCRHLSFTLCSVLHYLSYKQTQVGWYKTAQYIHKDPTSPNTTQMSLHTNSRAPTINALISAAISALCWVSQQKQLAIIVVTVNKTLHGSYHLYFIYPLCFSFLNFKKSAKTGKTGLLSFFPYSRTNSRTT